MADDVWDPDPLTVGTRVRIKLSGECRSYYPPLDLFGRHEPGFWTEHDAAEHGRAGMVDGLFDDPTGHPYSVVVDEPWWHHADESVWRCNGSMYARVELERLS